ncbi:mannose/fructose/sorbose PTS transporter subunit IIB [Clostridium algoriphilum]|uniref:mannose/fructose/sorbose PTS transporter subunit IIB n=1 Tax=Clostridium algoriphilum TaxID=198347 RepID=UPI001CF3706A|nr:mannose/fructose/sorbose PTS transporter subunit IIB [Clostridium algoriphilum]MCB2293818.1 mannose/fructose/sorbose PTS transporter subunit IIB [Clostridium algoriphilum]
MKISLARIDDRLIHGQVVTSWSKETRCERIIVCNDEVAADTMRKTLLEQVAPPGVKSSVISIEKAIRVLNNPKYANVNALLLFTNPTDVLRLVEGGVDLKTINIGGMSFKEGKKQITGTISVDEKDIEAFKKLDKLGIELEIRKVVADTKIKLMSKI